jgi:hypothetical protein
MIEVSCRAGNVLYKQNRNPQRRLTSRIQALQKTLATPDFDGI